jgi:hypothetical protein
MSKIFKVVNNKKKSFDHSNNTYYKIELENGKILLFTALELNKALNRYKKWSTKPDND